MKTEVLYMGRPEDNYIREFKARTIERGENFVVLDRTAFYSEGGGQPTDTGKLSWEGEEARVHRVSKEKGIIKHFVDAIPGSDEVLGIIDWERRYAHMRMHTAQHIISGVIFNLYGARTVGNQIHADCSHVDFCPANFGEEDLKRIEAECNNIAKRSIPVSIYEEEREVLEKKIDEQRAILDLIPKSISRLRVVQIGEFDVCPCAGTHVKNTSEIGTIHVLTRRSKGKDIERITYELM